MATGTSNVEIEMLRNDGGVCVARLLELRASGRPARRLQLSRSAIHRCILRRGTRSDSRAWSRHSRARDRQHPASLQGLNADESETTTELVCGGPGNAHKTRYFRTFLRTCYFSRPNRPTKIPTLAARRRTHSTKPHPWHLGVYLK